VWRASSLFVWGVEEAAHAQHMRDSAHPGHPPTTSTLTLHSWSASSRLRSGCRPSCRARRGRARRASGEPDAAVCMPTLQQALAGRWAAGGGGSGGEQQ
jgi:hypothetical protein